MPSMVVLKECEWETLSASSLFGLVAEILSSFPNMEGGYGCPSSMYLGLFS